jgi:hypothetical protein
MGININQQRSWNLEFNHQQNIDSMNYPTKELDMTNRNWQVTTIKTWTWPTETTIIGKRNRCQLHKYVASIFKRWVVSNHDSLWL